MIIKDLVKLANHLDKNGHSKEADYLDGLIKEADPTWDLRTDISNAINYSPRGVAKGDSKRMAKGFRSTIDRFVAVQYSTILKGFDAPKNLREGQWEAAIDSLKKLKSVAESEHVKPYGPFNLLEQDGESAWSLEDRLKKCKEVDKNMIWSEEEGGCVCGPGFELNDEQTKCIESAKPSDPSSEETSP